MAAPDLAACRSAWQGFLDHLDDPVALRDHATPEARAFPTAWLDPGVDGFPERVAAVQSGWPGLGSVTVFGDQAVASLWIMPWRQACWMFGPQITVRFTAGGGRVRVASVSFMGD